LIDVANASGCQQQSLLIPQHVDPTSMLLTQFRFPRRRTEEHHTALKC